MPDPPDALIYDRVIAPLETNGRELTLSTSIASSGHKPYHQQQSTNGVASYQNSHYDQKDVFAYAASPASAITFDGPIHQDSSVAASHDAGASAAERRQPGISTNADSASTLRLASFGSQPWPTTSAPYLDFAPQPIFEPTGELLYDKAEDFEHFDDPSLRRSTWPTQRAESTNGTQLETIYDSPGTNLEERSRSDPSVAPKSALKRPRTSDAATGDHADTSQGPDQESRKVRRVSFEHMSGIAQGSPDDDSSSSDDLTAPRSVAQARAAAASRRGRAQGSITGGQRQAASRAQQQPSSAQPPRGSRNPSGHPPPILPPEKVFPIRIGSELFQLSGASVSSDGPSYFTDFFEDQIKQLEESGGVRTLYIDRDPETFRDVARHLQGYYVKPRDGSHFVKLFADAQFYKLPRLIHQLFESEIFIQIGEKHFQIPKDIFSDPGNSPNFFSLGFAVFFSTPGEVFPGLDRRGLLRPPSITPPNVPGRSAEIFAQLLHLLRGYPLSIQNEEHRAELLRDCRYFHLRGLEQKIVAHEISYNPHRQKQEICLRIEDIKPSGVSYQIQTSAADDVKPTNGWVHYARPFVDDNAYELVVEIGGECTILDLRDMRVDFHGLAKARVSSLFQVVANKMNLPTNAPLGLMVISGGKQDSRSASPGHTPLSEDRVKAQFEPSTDIELDGQPFDIDWRSMDSLKYTHDPSNTDSGEKEMDSDPMSEDESGSEIPTKSAVTQRQQYQRGRNPIAEPEPSTHAQASLNTSLHTTQSSSRKRRFTHLAGRNEWIIRSGQWRLRVQPSTQDRIRGGYEIVMIAVKLDAVSHERARNARRGFLGG